MKALCGSHQTLFAIFSSEMISRDLHETLYKQIQLYTSIYRANYAD